MPAASRNGFERQRVLQASLAALDVAVSIAEAVPLIGATLKGSIEGLYKVLKLVDQKYQNAEDVASLAQRLVTLVERISEFEVPDRDSERLIKQLRTVEERLNILTSQKTIRHASIAQTLAGCHNHVNMCIQDFMLFKQIRPKYLTVVDPFGREQPLYLPEVISIQVRFPHAGELSGRTLKALREQTIATAILDVYHSNLKMQKSLLEFVSRGLYELTQNDGRRITSVTGYLKASAYSGAKVVMSVIVVAIITKQQTSICCPKCHQDIMQTPQDDGRAVCVNCEQKVSAVKTAEPLPPNRHMLDDSTSELEWFSNIRVTVHENGDKPDDGVGGQGDEDEDDEDDDDEPPPPHSPRSAGSAGERQSDNDDMKQDTKAPEFAERLKSTGKGTGKSTKSGGIQYMLFHNAVQKVCGNLDKPTIIARRTATGWEAEVGIVGPGGNMLKILGTGTGQSAKAAKEEASWNGLLALRQCYPEFQL